MQKQIRRLSFLVLVLTLFTVTAVAETTIVFWHWDREDRHAAVAPLIREFEQETGIKVEAQMFPWEELPEKLMIAAAGGVAPDVTAISWDRGGVLVFQGIYEDLTPYIERETDYDFDDLLPNALELWQTADGFQFGFPYDLDLSAFFYNKSLFDEIGVPYPDESMTWKRAAELARRFTVDRDGDGLPDQYGFANGHVSLDTFVWAYGGELVTPDLKNHGLGSPQARAGLEAFREISQPDANMDWGDATRFGFPHPPAAFGGGKIAMYPIGAFAPSAFWRDTTTHEYLVDFDVTFIPQGEEGTRGIQLNGQGMGMLSSSKNKDAAWEFIKFLSSPKVQAVSGSELGQMPVLRSVALESFINPDEPPANARVTIESTIFGRAHPMIPNWNDAWSTMRTQNSQYLLGSIPLSTLIQNLDELIPAILAR